MADYAELKYLSCSGVLNVHRDADHTYYDIINC